MKKGAGSSWLLLAAVACAWIAPVRAQDAPPGASVDSLLAYAREHNPEYAAMRLEADAAAERVAPSAALPDPKLRVELRDITRMGEQNPTLWPERVGSTRYQLMQDIPWFGKRDLRRQVAGFDAEGIAAQATANWAELAARIKTAHARLYWVYQSERYTREVLDLMARMESIARVRYGNGLAAQQDVIRAQVEQTALKTELVGLENERRQLAARMNGLLSRPAAAPLAEPKQLRPLPAPAQFDRGALEARLRAGNPQLFSAGARIRSAEKSRELVYKDRYPDFTLGVASVQYENALKEWELMLELNLPVQQAARRAEERESDAMLSAARTRAEATANQLLAELEEQLAGIDAARRTEALAGTSLLPQAELTLRAALAGYENGGVDFATLLDAQSQVLKARLERLKAQVEAQTRLAEIERLLGEDL